MHSPPERTLHEAAAFRILRWAVFLVLGLQVIVGQALAIGGARIMNPQATAVMNIFGSRVAELVAWSVGVLTIASAFRSGTQFWGSLLYSIYTVAIIANIWHIDPYIAGLYAVYCMLGVTMMAISRRPKADA